METDTEGDGVKRALIITSIGGFLPQFLKGDVRILRELGYEVHYASNFRYPVYRFSREELEQEGILLHQIPIRKSPVHLIANLCALIRLIRLIRREQIDLVHCHNPVGGAIGRLAAALSGREPVVLYTAHGFHFYQGAPLWYWGILYPVERMLAKRTDVLLTINREDAARARRFRLRRGGFVRMLHGVGVDGDRFRPRPEIREEIRRKLEVPADAFHLVIAAELNDNKNHRVILEALHLLKDPGIRFSICGRGPNQEMLETRVDELGLSEQVKLLGYRTDMPDVLQSADCFVFPSYREGFGIAAVEALTAGIPVIASDNRGTREYMVDGYNGLVCPADDVEAFAQAIRRMKEDTKLRQSCAQNAVRSAAPFSAKQTTNVMREVYTAADRTRE